MNKQKFIITEILNSDRFMIAEFIKDNWLSSIVVTKSRVHYAENLQGFLCRDDHNKIVGLVTYSIEDKGCEIVTLDSKNENIGLGTELIKNVIEVARANNCNRVWAITTNDNVNAIRYFQKREFEWIGFHENAIIKSREIKPEIPMLGFDKIPIKHEIEFEYLIPRTVKTNK